MASRKNHTPRGVAPCGDLGPDDGVDPRTFFSDEKRSRRDDHKVGRLCSQVARALRLVFPDAFADGAFDGLSIDSVVAGEDASYLVVWIASVEPLDERARALVMARLSCIRGVLRAEVAATVRRKRAPNLVFRIIGPTHEVPQ